MNKTSSLRISLSKEKEGTCMNLELVKRLDISTTTTLYIHLSETMQTIPFVAVILYPYD